MSKKLLVGGYYEHIVPESTLEIKIWHLQTSDYASKVDLRAVKVNHVNSNNNHVGLQNLSRHNQWLNHTAWLLNWGWPSFR